MEEEKKPDRRNEKTKQALQNALLALMNEKPMERISVSELAQAADVNRKTFYNHYRTVMDVRRDLDERYMDMIFGFLQEPIVNSSKENLQGLIHHIVEAIRREPVRARLLFESGETIYLTDKMEKIVLPHMRLYAAEHELSEQQVAYGLEFIAHGMVAVLGAWLTAEYPLPPGQLEQLLSGMVWGSVGEITEGKKLTEP